MPFTPIHGRNTVIYLGGYDLTSFFKKLQWAHTVAKADTTTFGATDETSLPGPRAAIATLNGLWDPTTPGGSHAVLSAIVGTAGQVLTTAPNGNALAAPVEVASGFEGKYTPGSDIGTATTADAEFQASGGLFYGVVQHTLQAETVTGNSAYVDGLASSSNGWVAHLHVTAISGAGAQLVSKIQDSADHITFADLTSAAFAAATAIGGQEITGTGVVRQYTQEVHTISGTTPSVTFLVAFARK